VTKVCLRRLRRGSQTLVFHELCVASPHPRNSWLEWADCRDACLPTSIWHRLHQCGLQTKHHRGAECWFLLTQSSVDRGVVIEQHTIQITGQTTCKTVRTRRSRVLTNKQDAVVFVCFEMLNQIRVAQHIEVSFAEIDREHDESALADPAVRVA